MLEVFFNGPNSKSQTVSADNHYTLGNCLQAVNPELPVRQISVQGLPDNLVGVCVLMLMHAALPLTQAAHIHVKW